MDIPEISIAKSASSVWDPITSCPVKREAVYFESLPSYEEFFENIFLRNQLCIFGSKCTENWQSRRLWVTPQGTPNFDYIKNHFGTAKAPVANCDAEEFCSHPKTEMLVSDFLDYWQEYRAAGHVSSSAHPCLYLKDWHFTRDFPSYHVYTPPSHLCSDWLNEFWDAREDTVKGDDYRFVYLGPKHTWTPFHSDVLRSYSWSANICGRKKWIFFPPGEENKLTDNYGQLVYDLKDPPLVDRSKYPRAEGVVENAIEVIQQPGEIVFVPSGWHHQVYNLEDTISINHNWVNGSSVHLTWAFLKARLATVKDEIADCSGMEGFDTQCQKILKADSGMDYVEFYNFVATIAKHRMWALQKFCHCKEECQENAINGTAQKPPTTPNDSDTMCVPPGVLCLWSVALANAKGTANEETETQNYLGCTEELDASLASNCCLRHGPALRSVMSKDGISEDVKSKDGISEDVTSKDGISEDVMSRDGISEDVKSKDVISEDVTSKDRCELQDGSSGGSGCPLWSHCGPGLCVFDLRRAAAVLKDVTGQTEWTTLVAAGGGGGRKADSETDTESVLVEEVETLMTSIDLTLAKAVQCLC